MAVELNTQNVDWNGNFPNIKDNGKNVKVPAQAVKAPAVAYPKDSIILTTDAVEAPKDKSILPILLSVIGGAGLIALLLTKGKGAGVGKKAQEMFNNSELNDVDSFIKNMDIISPKANAVKASSEFAEVPNIGAVEVPVLTPNFANVDMAVKNSIETKVSEIEKKSQNPFNDLYKYFTSGGEGASSQEKELSSIVAGKKLIENYSEKLLETGKFQDVTTQMANICFAKGDLETSKNLLNLTIKSSKDSVQKADLYEQLAVIAQKTGNRKEMELNYNNSFKQKLDLIKNQAAKVSLSGDRGERLIEQEELQRLNSGLKSFKSRVSARGVNNPEINEAIKYIELVDKNGIGVVAYNLSALAQTFSSKNLMV